MPRFSLKKLFVSMTLIAVGLGIAMTARHLPLLENDAALPLWILSGTIFGSGLGVLFSRIILGAIIGCTFIFAMYLLIMSTAEL